MPAGTRIGHIHLHVNDLDRAMAFYRDGIGFGGLFIMRRFGMGDLGLDYTPHAIAFNIWAGPNARQQPARPRRPPLVRHRRPRRSCARRDEGRLTRSAPPTPNQRRPRRDPAGNLRRCVADAVRQGTSLGGPPLKREGDRRAGRASGHRSSLPPLLRLCSWRVSAVAAECSPSNPRNPSTSSPDVAQLVTSRTITSPVPGRRSSAAVSAGHSCIAPPAARTAASTSTGTTANTSLMSLSHASRARLLVRNPTRSRSAIALACPARFSQAPSAKYPSNCAATNRALRNTCPARCRRCSIPSNSPGRNDTIASAAHAAVLGRRRSS